MKININELTDLQLNYAAALCEGYGDTIHTGWSSFEHWADANRWEPTEHGDEIVTILEREGIAVCQVFEGPEGAFARPTGWSAYRHTLGGPISPPRHPGPTPRIAILRCYVASRMGDTIDIPEGLL